MEIGTLQRHYAREVRSGKRQCSSLTGLALLCAIVLCILLVLWPGAAQAQEQSKKLSLEAPQLVLKDVPFSVNVTSDGSPANQVRLRVAGEGYEVNFSDGTATVEDVVVQETGGVSMSLVAAGEEVSQKSTQSIPGWLSILPPLLAIGIALIFRQVIPALFAGIYVGAAMTYGLSPSGLWHGLLDTINVYIIEAIAPPTGAPVTPRSLSSRS